MAPPPFLSISGTQWRMVSAKDFTLIAMTRSQTSMSISVQDLSLSNNNTPVVLTR